MTKNSRMVHVSNIYAYTGGLAEGCKLCIRGTKIVVFITGLCSDKCFYCPVSDDRIGRDIVYVDEEKAANLNDIVNEALRVGAEGASITGGEPLLRPRRVIAVIRTLKKAFGDSFHIHLYTTGRQAYASLLRQLERAGLDEIRFHPVEPWLVERVKTAIAVRRDMRVGVEVPVIPDRLEHLRMLLAELDRIGVDFVNLNELEASTSNISRLRLRGYSIVEKRSVVKGSYEAGIELVKWASENLTIPVHFCPAKYKDMVQLRNRMVRKAVRTRAWFEKPTAHGQLRVGVVPREACKKPVECGPCANGFCLTDPDVARRLGGSVVELPPTTTRYVLLDSLTALPDRV